MQILFPVGFLILFWTCWYLIGFYRARTGGWSALAARYGAQEPPVGKLFPMERGRVGAAFYRCLHIHVSDSGLYLSVWFMFRAGHRPLFIPWTQLYGFHEKKSLIGKWLEIQVGNPPVTTLELPHRVIPKGVVDTKRAGPRGL